MESISIDVVVARSEGKENPKVCLVFPELENSEVILTDSSVEDIENLFSTIFKTIVEKEQILNFVLKDSSQHDLYTEVAQELVGLLNQEIQQSELDFTKIIELNRKLEETS